jgi:hypothetical protein
VSDIVREALKAAAVEELVIELATRKGVAFVDVPNLVEYKLTRREPDLLVSNRYQLPSVELNGFGHAMILVISE